MTDPPAGRPCYVEVVVNRPLARRPVTRAVPAPPGEASDAHAPVHAFTYAVPEPWCARVRPGHLVEVPFRDTTLQGVVVALADRPPDGITPRPITGILDPTPIVSAVQLHLAGWLSHSYLAPLSECIWLFLPPGTRRAPQLIAEAVPDRTLPSDIDARAAALHLYLQRRGPTPAAELEAGTLRLLTDIEAARVRQRLAPPRAGPQLDRTVELIASPEEVTAALPTLGHPSKQADVLLYLAASADPLPALPDVLSAVGCGKDVVRRLAECGAVQLTPRRTLAATPLSGPQLEAALAALTSEPDQHAALTWLRNNPGPQALPLPGVTTATLAALEKKGYLRRWTEPATVSLMLAPDEVWPAVIELRGATRQAQVLDLLAREEGRVWVGWVYVHTDATLETLRQLAAAGLLELDEARRWRDPLADQPRGLERAPQLTADQSVAVEAIRAASAGGPGAFLLHGVTGSGKTEIYLRAVADALERGQGAIILVPEIALAAQTIQRVAGRFPGRVAIWHSDLSLGERFDTWQRVQAGELPVVVGPRSALFAPVLNLGLIVVDEEHEPAYKAERSPRYHARDVALRLGELAGAVVILGSATPDVTTYRRAERREIALLSLPRRVLAHRQYLAVTGAARPLPGAPVNGMADLRALPLPPVEVVDLAAELKAGNRSIFSRTLQTALRETLAAGRQAILFLNRRGAATFVLCRDCGYVMRCRHCDVSLTYHADQAQLICHHCNRRQSSPERCPACGSARIRYFGLGTERVEEAMHSLLPTARLLRWDADTARLRGSHAAFLDEFTRGRADVLIGTQMIAKGLDLPGVTLVGVISADTSLYLPDFRAAERTFQLLTQVAGRAGRSPLGGRVIIQTYHPDLPLIRAAAQHDYATFYSGELQTRLAGRYPPFKRLARLVFGGSGAERAQREAERMAEFLRLHVARLGEPGVEVVGPAPCFYPRLGGLHRWHVLVRADHPEQLLRAQTLPLGWRLDIDPIDLL